VVLDNNPYGPGTGDIILDDVRCNGDEQSLADCQHAAWGRSNCGHDKDVAIKCIEDYAITGTRVQNLHISAKDLVKAGLRHGATRPWPRL